MLLASLLFVILPTALFVLIVSHVLTLPAQIAVLACFLGAVSIFGVYPLGWLPEGWPNWADTLISAALEEALKLVPVVFLYAVFNVRSFSLIGAGLASGAGFGGAENLLLPIEIETMNSVHDLSNAIDHTGMLFHSTLTGSAVVLLMLGGRALFLIVLPALLHAAYNMAVPGDLVLLMRGMAIILFHGLYLLSRDGHFSALGTLMLSIRNLVFYLASSWIYWLVLVMALPYMSYLKAPFPDYTTDLFVLDVIFCVVLCAWAIYLLSARRSTTSNG